MSSNDKKSDPSVVIPEDQNIVRRAEIVESILEYQERDLEFKTRDQDLKSREFDLQAREQDYGFQYASSALEAQLQDSKDERRFVKGLFEKAVKIAVFALIAILLFFAFALYMGNDQIVLEVFKLIAYFGVGGAGGYFAGRSKKSSGIDLEETE